jgi:hypothetical protein
MNMTTDKLFGATAWSKLARNKNRHFSGEGQVSQNQDRLIHVLFTIICPNANIHDTRFAVLKKNHA